MQLITDTILQATQSPWILLIVFALVVLDGFFPPVPSETVIVAVAAVSAGTGHPPMLALIAVSALGALLGDSIAYLIGARLGAARNRVRWLRGPRVEAAIARAGAGLAARPAIYLLTARYIPIGRLAVNLAAGATSLPARVFVPLATIAGAGWAALSVAIGLLAGKWVDGHPLLGALLGIAAALLLGAVIEGVRRLIDRVRRRRKDAGSGPAGRNGHPHVTRHEPATAPKGETVDS